jgi:hypothetical protein
MTDTRPAIRLVDYMSSDSLDFANIIGPYGTVQARNAALNRLASLPLGRPEYHGGQQYKTATMADAVGEPGWSLRVVTPEQMAKATTQYGAHCALHGFDEEDDEEPAPDPHEPHPDQISIYGVLS